MNIFNRLTGALLFSSPDETPRATLEAAVKAGVRLVAVDLRGLDLSCGCYSYGYMPLADFTDSNLIWSSWQCCNLLGAEFGGTRQNHTDFSHALRDLPACGECRWFITGQAPQCGNAFVYLDVDYNTALNNLYGMRFVNEVLGEIKHRVEQYSGPIRGFPTLEQYCFIIPAREALTIANSIHEDVRAMSVAHPLSEYGVVTVSIGAALTAMGAEQAFREAKTRGRNCTVANFLQ